MHCHYFIFALLIVLPCHLFSTTYYVSNSGLDTNDGLGEGSAFETLQHAADIVTAGDMVLVADGTYTGFALWQGGSAGQRIIFKAMGSEAIINMPSTTTDGINVENAHYVTIEGFVVLNQPRNGIRIALSNHCIVRKNRCDNNFERGIFTAFTDDILIEYNICSNSIDEHGIYVSNSSDRPIIRYNECFDNNNIGIHMNGDLSAGGDGIISDAEVYGNFIHDNHLAAGINMDGVLNAEVYNNLIVNNHFSQGIALFQQDGAVVTQGTRVFNNTIIVPDDGRWGILMTSGANSNTQIFNNIIVNLHPWRGSISCESTDDLSSDWNLLINSLSNQGDGSSISLVAWQALGLDTNSTLAGPLDLVFIDTSKSDYHLKMGTWAIDNGLDSLVNAIVVDDIHHNLRPIGMSYDIGCFEYQKSSFSAMIEVVNQELLIQANDEESQIFVEGNLSDVQVKVLDASDQLVEDYTGNPSPVIFNVASLGPGSFFIQLIDDGSGQVLLHALIKK